ncbi:hypothetical protein KXD93_14895 [Mucilaginibacter sp. BJC16-A38]|uniref:hypothetical protein n=1 Tax=Mucilaginibacter phenanthrenivorans TaxID=1234842 RepID=UPI0021587A66|nr:hypothetical protein [Mucilaginibacter phenanthrenivorans]MCR8558942.1 hypothetical protein [Mucilaginibacter phenanthrenivorans]
MKAVLKRIMQILAIGAGMPFFSPALAQPKRPVPVVKRPVAVVKHVAPVTPQLAEFNHLAAQADVIFTFPRGFKEIPAPDNDYFSFDYAMTIPGKDFEIWFTVKSQKENWASYEKSKNAPNAELANPDSTYVSLADAHAAAFTGETKYFVKNIPPEVLARYNADAGKSYLLTLLDLPATKRYKYALLITLQKDHTGIIMAVCFTNDKGPEFFKNIDRASNCLKFKPQG